MPRTVVRFGHPAPFIPYSPDDGILSTKGVEWFVSILRDVRCLKVDPDLIQEDWGVVVFVELNDEKFWCGISAEEDGYWLAQLHLRGLALLRRIGRSGNRQLERLSAALHVTLEADPSVSEIDWRPSGSAV